jgi:hypothetical protein
VRARHRRPAAARDPPPHFILHPSSFIIPQFLVLSPIRICDITDSARFSSPLVDFDNVPIRVARKWRSTSDEDEFVQAPDLSLNHDFEGGQGIHGTTPYISHNGSYSPRWVRSLADKLRGL